MKQSQISLYIHIPFCVKKCFYCDFNSFISDYSTHELYVDALISEIKQQKSEYSHNVIKTIFLGGGTPTILTTKLLGKIIDALFSSYNISNDCEITIEANPKTIDVKVLNELKNMYFNRLSIGVQSFYDSHLEKLGRVHKVNDFFDNLDNALLVGFKNINLDLMFSLPFLTLTEWENTLKRAVSLDVTHISAYSLIVEENTPFFKLFNDGTYKELDEEIDREMYYIACDILSDAGFNQYEISNFSKENYMSKHNLTYWKCNDYIGFGLSAHSLFDGYRFNNTDDIKKYLKFKGNVAKIVDDRSKLTLENRMGEFMFMGLRLNAGVSLIEFNARFNENVSTVYKNEIEKLTYEKVITVNDDVIKLTKKGVDVSNYVFEHFIL